MQRYDFSLTDSTDGTEILKDCKMDKNSWMIRFARRTPRWIMYVALALAVLAVIGIWVMLLLTDERG